MVEVLGARVLLVTEPSSRVSSSESPVGSAGRREGLVADVRTQQEKGAMAAENIAVVLEERFSVGPSMLSLSILGCTVVMRHGWICESICVKDPKHGHAIVIDQTSVTLPT